MPKKKTKEEFIKEATEKHEGKYNYSKVEYINNKTKVCIICKKHGEFWQTPNSHLQGRSCPKCGIKKMRKKNTFSQEDFIKKARSKHGDKYDYSKVNYVNNATKVCIICPDHGEFYQTPHSHTQGRCCPKCGGKYVPTTEEWIASAREVHGDKYYYSKVEYVNGKKKVCIICPDHGKFWQTPNAHPKGCGCPKCSRKYVPTTEEWITFARKKHGNKYDYTKVKYVGALKKVCIICPDHGEFWQTPNSHTIGAGCPKCNLSHLERSVMNYLDENGINYDYQKHFKWLGMQSLDFYLPDYKMGIECQGEQHFFPVDFAGKGVEWSCKNFEYVISCDKRKKALCDEHDIKLLYFGDTPNYNTFLGEVVHDDVQHIIDYLK